MNMKMSVSWQQLAVTISRFTPALVAPKCVQQMHKTGAEGTATTERFRR